MTEPFFKSPEIPALMPLRIPSGYAVCFNEFYDVAPMAEGIEDATLANGEFFGEDLLQITKLALSASGAWQIPQAGRIVIDLGWYPAGHSRGEYRLVEAVVSADNSEWKPRTVATSRSRYEICEILFRLMSSLHA